MEKQESHLISVVGVIELPNGFVPGDPTQLAFS
jgi:hypothetical protein